MAPEITSYENYAFFLVDFIKDTVPLDWHRHQTDHPGLHKKATTTFYMQSGRKDAYRFHIARTTSSVMLNFFGFSALFG